ncbi:MAG: hypothetical protein PHD51_02215 [Patescibacteria group bacterium]|nr:hypothetical protein [Patescibacteria group bacterium]MDD5490324.1 hypothetical protein [Patescibacteria group bacterium]
MKKILVATIFFIAFANPLAKAETEKKVYLEERTLIVSTVEQRIPDVPEGISAEMAYKLVTGEQKEFVIKDVRRENIYRFSFPMQEMAVFSNRTVGYSQEHWVEIWDTRTERKAEWVLTFFMFIIPALCILIVSLVNQLKAKGGRRLFVFYAAILISAALAAGVGWFADKGCLMDKKDAMFLSALVGLSAGAVGCGFAGSFATEITLNSSIAGLIAGMLVGGFVGIYAVRGIIAPYIMLIVASEIVAFAISLSIKKLLPTVKGWLTTD